MSDCINRVPAPVLYAASLAYGVATEIRNWLYDRKLLSSRLARLPIISVGNVTVGGNAKTPLCAWLVKKLASAGMRPAILSRGYGGNVRGPHVVGPEDSAAAVGDEPVLLARSSGVPVVVSRRRARGHDYIADCGLGDVIVLDDGLQHRALQRHFDIVCINLSTPQSRQRFSHEALLPRGYWRESSAAGLGRAHAVVVLVAGESSCRDADVLRLCARIPERLPVFFSWYEDLEFFELSSDEPVTLTDEVAAFCGLAQPEGFFAALSARGVRLIGKEAFPDHYHFSTRDLETLRLKYPHATLVCTAKDAVKLSKRSGVGSVVVAQAELHLKGESALLEAIISAIRPVPSLAS